MARSYSRCNLLDNLVPFQDVVVADGWTDRELSERQLPHISGGSSTLHTFLEMTGSWWNNGARTSLATFSRLSSFALPMRVMGLSRLQNLVLLICELLAASSQIRRTKETGSMGALVLKKSTLR